MSTKQTWIIRVGLPCIGMALGIAGICDAEETALCSSNGSVEVAVQVFGQEPASKPNFFDKAKQKISDFFSDKDDAPPAHNRGAHGNGGKGGTSTGTSTAPATRVTPPKPVTAPTGRAAGAENTETADAGTADRSPTTPARSTRSTGMDDPVGSADPRSNTETRTMASATASPASRSGSASSAAEREEIWKRMEMMRQSSNFASVSPAVVNDESRRELAWRDGERLQASNTAQSTGSSGGNFADRAEQPPRQFHRQENANEFLKRPTAPESAGSGSKQWQYEPSATWQRNPYSTEINDASHAQNEPYGQNGRNAQDPRVSTIANRSERRDAFSAQKPIEQTPGSSPSIAGNTASGFETLGASPTAPTGRFQENSQHRPHANRSPWGGGSVDIADAAPVTVPPAVSETAEAPANAPGLNLSTPEPQPATAPAWKNEHSKTSSRAAFSGNSTTITVEGDETTDREKSILSSPILELETIGPQRVIVGQESPYQIKLFNRGGTAAEQFVLRIDLPTWVDVQPPEVSAGATSIAKSENPNGTRAFLWKIDRIESKSEEQLVLHLVPKERKSFNLKMDYDFKRLTAVSPIEVQEPKLDMTLEGPAEVLWGSEEIYRLRIRNTGNGDAENVKLALLPGTTEPRGEDATCTLELLKAGEEITIDVKAKALQSDFLDISVVANGPFALQAKASRRVNVLRANLDVVVESPELLFVGSNAEYTVRVRNTGNAPANGVDVLASVPLGAKYVSCTGNGRATPQNEVLWNIESIPVDGEFTATILCELKRQGLTKLEVAATDQSGLATASTGETQVESIADLKMRIANPQGPVEINSEAVYTISISNNGTRAAEGVEVDAMFSDHIDPVGFEGLGGEITSTGHVLFEPVQTISPGQTISVKIRAKAVRPGNHKIRAELSCQSNGLQLVHEESTYYYARRSAKIASSHPAPKAAHSTPKENPVPAAPATVTTQAIQSEQPAVEPAPISPFAGATQLPPAEIAPWK